MNDEERAGYIERIGHLGKALDCQQREIGKLREMLIRALNTKIIFTEGSFLAVSCVEEDIQKWWEENR